MPQAENFSIVVVGGMNPRVHSALFYRTINLISDDELRAAHAAQTTIILPQTAQLDLAADVRVVCLPDRWQISTPNEERTARILEVASAVHRALDHTPVLGFGFNFDFVRPVHGAPERRFAELARTLPLGFGDGDDAAASFSYVTRTDDVETRRRHTVHISPLTDPADQIFVKNNFHHEITPRAGGHFDLGTVMQARFARDHDAARAQVQRTIAQLGGS